MAKVKFPKSFLIDALELPWSNSPHFVEEKLVDSNRWSLVYELIFKDEGKYYRCYYSVGATEIQDEGPWEYVSDVECEEVHHVDKVVKVWEAISDD